MSTLRVFLAGALLATTVALASVPTGATAPFVAPGTGPSADPLPGTTGAWYTASALVGEDGRTSIAVERHGVPGPELGAQPHHGTECTPIFPAPIGAWCGPIQHGTGTLEQSQGFGWGGNFIGTLRGYLGPSPALLTGWVLTCHINGEASSCNISGAPAVGIEVEQFCTSSNLGTSVPGGLGFWSCFADEQAGLAP